MADIGKLMLDQFKPREVSIDCVRCRRHAHVTTAALRKKFGNQRMDVIARMVARAATDHAGTCGLANDPFAGLCAARPVEVDPVLWAEIHDAEKGGWRAYLHCNRRLEGLKRSKSCEEVVALPVLVLKSLLGRDFPLERIPTRCRCPHCGSRSIQIEWVIPAEAPDPGGMAEATDEAPVLQLRPAGAVLARKRFRVIEKPAKRAAGGGDDG